MSNLNISNLNFQQSEVGKLIKGSKHLYSWEMILDGNKRKVELIHSRITGKRRIFLDGKVVAKLQRYTLEFQYSFLIEKHYVIIIQTAPDSYELRIDNISFSTLLNQEKIDKFNKMRKGQAKEVTPFNGGVHVNDNNNFASKVNKIDQDFFANYDNKFSQETYFQEKNYFKNEDWNLDKKEKSIVVNKTGDIFNNNDFEFSNTQQTKVPSKSIDTNNLLIVKKNSSNIKAPDSNQNKSQNNQNLLDLNDILSGGNKPTETVVNNKSNDLLFDFNFQNNTGQAPKVESVSLQINFRDSILVLVLMIIKM